MKGFKLRWISSVFFALIFLLTTSYCKKAEDDRRTILLQITLQALNTAHFQPLNFDDAFSQKVFDLYLKRLDGSKLFLTAKDYESLKAYQNKLDDQIKDHSFQFLDQSITLINQRIKEAESYYKEILNQPFDFNKEENYEGNPKKLKYAENEAEVKESWRKYLKYQTLIRLDEILAAQDKAKEKKDTSYKEKSFEKMEEEARTRVRKSQTDLFKRLIEIDAKQRLGDYLNAIANSYDPHTEYFAPKDKENFDIQMTGQLEGIGATLGERDGNVRVASIVPGSASYRQGQLKAGDIILKVAQGSQEPVDVTDMRLDDVVAMVRGKKGTEVRLTVKKADNSIVVIPIIRDIVILEETYARSAVLENKNKIGYIHLPIFYTPNRPGGRSSGDDVKKELVKLKNEDIKGLILDLRDNGGGSLQDVVDMVGLFIEKGPVVQVKSKAGTPTLLDDTDNSVVYDGPLVVMVNNNSASASEILAAAIQDYKRGVIVGTNGTFGKGTVQRFFNLDEFVNPSLPNVKPLGSIKITMQKFYRVNGGATQLKGVTPDITLPDAFTYVETGEKDQDYPMAWDVIPPVKINPWNKPLNIEKLKKESKARVQNNTSFNLINEQALKIKKQKDETLLSLNLKKFRDQQSKNKEDWKKYDVITKENPLLNAVDLKSAQPISDTLQASRSKEFFKNLKKDIYIFEATEILNDVK